MPIWHLVARGFQNLDIFRRLPKITCAHKARNLRNLREKTRVFRAIFGKTRQKVRIWKPVQSQVFRLQRLAMFPSQ